MAGHAAPNIVEDGLVFYVDPMNPRSWTGPNSSTVNNLSSNTTGSIFNDTSGSYGDNNSFTFDGVDDYIEIGAIGQGPLYDIGTGDFTVNMWCAKDTTSTYGWFISNFDSGVNGFAMGVWNDSTSLYWRIYPAGFTDSGYNIPSDLSFHNYTLTRNSETVDIYVDAVLVYNSTHATFTGTLSAELVPTYLGKRSDGYAEQPWNGNIANVQIYNSALSAQEVKQNYNALKSRFT